jgi:hypothetical protein
MSNQEILEKAIKKAIDGGWQPDPDDMYYKNEFEYPMIIFRHSFTKALWGDGQMGKLPKHGLRVGVSGWQMHLQQMVIADDPIKYLGDNI